MDMGDFMSTDAAVADARSEFVFSVMEDLGTTAATFGERELSNWSLTSKLMDRGRIPFVSTNLSVVADGVARPLAPRYIVREVNGVKVGFVGVIGSAEFTSAEISDDVDIVYEDAHDALASVIPQVRKEAEVVVLLSHMDGRNTDRLVEDVAGIDVALIGHRARTEERGRQTGSCIVNEAGIRGQYAGLVRVIVSTGGEVLDWGGENVALDAAVDLDQAVQRSVDDHENEIKLLRQESAQASRRNVDGKFHSSRYLGGENCRRCHVSEHEQWLSTAHARAFATLVEAGKQQEDQCVGCHVTGSGDVTGFAADLTEPDLHNVQCESCHGMGSEHARGPEAARVTEQTCLKCHDAANSPGFDYAEYLQAVVH